MIANPPQTMICFPPAACNGGPLEKAPPKIGNWRWQPKVDDWRAVIHTPSMSVWNQYGQPSTISDKFAVTLRHLTQVAAAAEWLDVGMMEQRNDMMRGCIIVFDLIEPKVEQWARYARLKAMFPILPFDVSTWLLMNGGQVRDSIFLVNQWDDIQCKAAAMRRQEFLQNQNYRLKHKFFEGMIAKRRDSLYQFGTRAKQECPAWIKHRFDQ